MAKKAKSFIALAALLLIAGCAKQAEPQANDTKSTGPSADMLLSDSDEPDVPPLAPRLEDIDVIPRKPSEEDEQTD